jgi:hypothetical protein
MILFKNKRVETNVPNNARIENLQSFTSWILFRIQIQCRSTNNILPPWWANKNNESRFLKKWLIYWLIIYGCTSLSRIFSLIWRRHHSWWRAAKFRPMLGAQNLWAGRDLYHATPAVTRDLGFSGLIRRTAPFCRLLRHTRGCGVSILTRILTGFLKKGTPQDVMNNGIKVSWLFFKAMIHLYYHSLHLVVLLILKNI